MTRQPVPAAARTGLRLAGLLAVLAGLFGMHGLASQCVVGMENMSHAVPADPAAATTAVADLGALSSALSKEVGPALQQGASAMARPLMPEGTSMTMAGLCVAILVMGIGALWLLGRSDRPGPVLWTLPRKVATSTTADRDPDPPSLTALSIQRC